MKITMHGNPLTLVGTPIKTGETAPVFYGINQQMQPVSLKEFAGKVVVISSFPSIDTPVCSAQMHHFNKMASELSQDSLFWLFPATFLSPFTATVPPKVSTGS